MNCQKVSPLLSLYLDRELDDLDHKRVEKHIQICPACNRELDTLARTVRVIKAAAVMEIDDQRRESEWIIRKR